MGFTMRFSWWMLSWTAYKEFLLITALPPVYPEQTRQSGMYSNAR